MNALMGVPELNPAFLCLGQSRPTLIVCIRPEPEMLISTGVNHRIPRTKSLGGPLTAASLVTQAT